jgi:hypothetical protein
MCVILGTRQQEPRKGTTVTDLTGHYAPNTPGARTLADARPLHVGDKRVTVVVEGRTAYLYVGGTYDMPRELPDHFTSSDVNLWAQQMIADGYTGEPQTTPSGRIYPAWWTALMAERQTCTDTDSFEREAYQGYVSHGIGGTDGHYAPKAFETWVHTFRKSPINALYIGNDARYALAPMVLSYVARIV